MKRLLLIFLVPAMLLAACTVAPAEPDDYFPQVQAPAPVSEPEPEPLLSEIEILESDTAPYYKNSQEEIALLKEELARNIPIGTHPIPAEQREIYYNFFKNNFEVREIETMHEYHLSMSHNIHGEIRQTETVYFNRIEGFDDPVLVIWEFRPVDYLGVGTAYLIRNGEIKSDLSRAEFDAIFREADDRSFLAIHENESFSAFINGENLIDLRIRDEHGVGIDLLLNWLSEY